MIIGIDASRATRGRRTGTENYSLAITRALLRQGRDHTFRLYCNQAPPPGLFGSEADACVRVLPSPYLWTHGRLAWELRRHPPQILFVPAHVVPVYRPCPAVVTVHDLGFLRFPAAHPPLSRLYLRWGTLFSVRVARRVIAVSEATKADLVTLLQVPAAKIDVVPEACPPGFRPLGDREAGLAVARRYGLSEPYILSIGSLHPRKNLVRLVEAFAIARRQAGLPHKLGLVGQPGWRSHEVEAAVARLGLAEVVVATGFVPEHELPLLLGAAQALAFPSLYEGFGLPALEAMASGVPVVAANTSSLPEVVGEAGLLVDPLRVDELAAALVRLLTDDELRRECARRGLARARAFSWERAATETLAVLQTAVT